MSKWMFLKITAFLSNHNDHTTICHIKKTFFLLFLPANKPPCIEYKSGSSVPSKTTSKLSHAYTCIHTMEATLQDKKRCLVSSRHSPHNTQTRSCCSTNTFLLTRFSFVGTLSKTTCRERERTLVGTLHFQKLLKI